jgi:hypothetical protein
MTRSTRASFVLMAVLVAIGLGLALGLGAPDPGIAERAAAGAFGALALAAALLSAGAAIRRATDPPRRAPDVPSATDAGTAGIASLERSLRFGASSAGDFHAHVRPRLVALAAARLGSHGIELGDRDRATAALGPAGYALVDPASGPPGDRFAPGVAIATTAELVDRLDRLGGRP